MCYFSESAFGDTTVSYSLATSFNVSLLRCNNEYHFSYLAFLQVLQVSCLWVSWWRGDTSSFCLSRFLTWVFLSPSAVLSTSVSLLYCLSNCLTTCLTTCLPLTPQIINSAVLHPPISAESYGFYHIMMNGVLLSLTPFSLRLMQT